MMMKMMKMLLLAAVAVVGTNGSTENRMEVSSFTCHQLFYFSKQCALYRHVCYVKLSTRRLAENSIMHKLRVFSKNGPRKCLQIPWSQVIFTHEVFTCSALNLA